MNRVLVTGSSGLIGSEVCSYFARELGCAVDGVDNNQRAVFFGAQGDTRWNQQRLERELKGFTHHEVDIRGARHGKRFRTGVRDVDELPLATQSVGEGVCEVDLILNEQQSHATSRVRALRFWG